MAATGNSYLVDGNKRDIYLPTMLPRKRSVVRQKAGASHLVSDSPADWENVRFSNSILDITGSLPGLLHASKGFVGEGSQKRTRGVCS